MKKRNLHQNRTLRSVLLVLLLCVVGMTNAIADQKNHDFTAVAANGQTLYYKITSTTEHSVMVTHPNDNTTGLYYYGTCTNCYYNCGEGIKYYNNPYFKYSYNSSYNNPNSWNYYAKPSGELIIPYYVEYNGISYSVTAIDSYAFGTTYNNSYACTGLTSVVIPSSVLTIGEKAFANCIGLTTVTIPTSVTSIGSSVFSGCSNLITVNFNATNCSSVGSNTWVGCTNFTTLNLGNTVTRIPNNGFQSAPALASVIIPRKVTIIGNCAFNGCTNLANVTIANNSVLTSIGQYAFQNCSNLTNVTFNGTSQLNSIDTYAFQKCSKLATINLPNTLLSIGNYAFNGCSLLQSTTESQLLPNALEAIGDYAFQNATTLAYIRIPNTVTSIGKYAFKSCTALNTVDFEATNCTYSGTQAEPPFFYCSGLSTVNVSDNVTQIPAYCFKDCTSLSHLTLPNGLSEIGTYAFYCCMNINSLVLPASVTSIGSFAFGNAYDMQIANVESHNPTPPTIGEEAVFPAGQTIYVPYASLNDYELAEYWEDYFFEGMAVKTVSGYGTGNGNWAFIASPLTDANLALTAIENMIPSNDNYDLYRFNQSAAMEWENYKAHTQGFVLENGQGYLYANQENVNIIFKGEFNEGTSKDVELAYTEGMRLAGWNLVGNPFPYAATVSRSYYVMNEYGTGIAPTALSEGSTIEACTGIVVKAETTGESVTFSKPTRTTGENKGLLHIDLVNEDKAIVSFNEGDQLGKFYFGEQNANIYIPQGEKEYAIAYSNGQGEMPLNFKAAKNGEYTITVAPEGVEMEYLHLIDNMTGADVDLLQTLEYTFNATTHDYESRFRLVFVCGDANDDNETFAFIDANGNIVIDGEGTVQVIDVMGHVLVSVGGHTRCVPTSGMTPGVYVLRLVNGEDVKVQKIVVR